MVLRSFDWCLMYVSTPQFKNRGFKMTNFKKLHLVEVQALFFLWSIAIINCLELFLYKFHFFEVDSTSFRNLIAVSFYGVWTAFGALFCAIGISGIHEFRPNFLKKICVPYLLCSATCKGILAITLLLPNNDDFYRAIEYASSEPLWLILIKKCISNDEITPTNLVLFHVLTIVFLTYAAFVVHCYRNKIQKNLTRIQTSYFPEDF